MEITFKTKNLKQLEASRYWLDDTTEEILYGGAKGGGKSFLGCSLIFGDALIYPGTHYYIARKELNDLRKYTIPSIHEVFHKWGIDITKYAPFNGQDNIFNLYNKSKVFLVPCKIEPSDPMFERFGSMQMTRGWLEEAGEVAEAAKANLWLATGRWKNEEYKLKKKQLSTANPKKGWLKRDFVDPWRKNELLSNKKFVQAFATDNPYLSEDYLKTLREEKDTVRRQRLWLGDWDYDEDKDSMLSLEALSDAFSNTIVKEPKRYLVVDVARFGEDHTVYSFWEGLEWYKTERFNGHNIEETKRRIKDYCASDKIPFSHVLVDEAGVGGGVVDGLSGINGFTSASRPFPTQHEVRGKISKLSNEYVPKTNFANLKAQCAMKLAELINERKTSFTLDKYRDMIMEDLTSLLRYKDVSSDGKITLRSKDEAKIELGRSPDVGDTAIMRAWFELRKESFVEDPVVAHAQSIQRETFLINTLNQKQNSAK